MRLPPPPGGTEEAIRRHIVERGLGPGDRLPSEAELATAFRAARVVVREALRSLEAVGLLEARAGSGWYVRAFEVSTATRALARSLAFHPAAFLDLLALRRSMEVDLVLGVAGRLGTSDLDALEELADRMAWRAARGQMFPVEDGEFHRRLVTASGNQIALALSDLFWAVMAAMYARGLPGPAAPALATSALEHRRVVAALRAGDGPAASRILRTSMEEPVARVAAWRRGGAAGGGSREDDTPTPPAVDAAVMAALLWPGPRAALE